MQRPIEQYLKESDRLAQVMVNAWAVNVQAGNASLLTDEFKEVFELCCEFRNQKQVADNWRKHGIPTEGVDAILAQARLMFAQAYKAMHEKHEAAN